MKFINVLICYLLIFNSLAFGQASNPNDTLKIGKKNSSADKGFIFETNDGVSNKTLKVNPTSKGLLWSGNLMQIGDGASSNDKELIIDPASSTSIKWDGTESTIDLVNEKVRIGEGSDADTTIEFNIGSGATNPKIKWDSAKQKFRQSINGSDKDLGSGSGAGGGENYNNGFTSDDNANAEDGTTGWTASAGVFSASAIDPLEGDQSFLWTPSAQNDTLDSPILVFDRDKFKGQSCEARFNYIGGDENLTAQVIDGNNDVLGSEVLSARSVMGVDSVFFLCPSQDDITGDAQKGNLRLRLLNEGAIASAQIKFDKSYVGTLIGLSETVVSGDVGEYLDTSSGVCPVGSIPADGSAVSRTTYSQLFAKIGTNYGVGDGSTTFNLPDARGVFFRGEGSNSTITANGGVLGLLSEDIFKSHSHSVGYGNYAAFNAGTISRGATGGQTGTQSTSSTGGSETKPDSLTVKKCIRYKLVTQKIYKSIPKVSENVNTFSAEISSSGTLATQNVSWITTCFSSGVGRKGCNIDPSVFENTIPACVVTAQTTAQGTNVSFDGIDKAVISYEVTNSSNTLVDVPVNIICQKQEADFKMPTVQPIIVGQVANSYAESASKNVRVESCRVDNTGTPVINTNSKLCEPWIDSLGDVGTGIVDVNVKAGIFTSDPVCTCSIVGQSASRICHAGAMSSSTIRIYTRDTNGNVDDENFSISCKGVR
jgi:microcystin-dependent protein